MVALQELSTVESSGRYVDSSQAEVLRVRSTNNHVPTAHIHTVIVKGCSNAFPTADIFGWRNMAAVLHHINQFIDSLQNQAYTEMTLFCFIAI